jgi:hypothetical protein
MEPGEGERLHAAKRRRFWWTLGGLAVVGALAGAVGQTAIEIAKGGPLPAWTATWGGVGVVMVVLLVVVGSWRFFATVDELELADNLWASLVGFYWYVILFPAWWALHKLGWTTAPDQWAIFVSAMLASCAVYFFRKWQNR